MDVLIVSSISDDVVGAAEAGSATAIEILNMLERGELMIDSTFKRQIPNQYFSINQV